MSIWETRRLGEVCDFQNGFAFKSDSYSSSGIPVLRITNLQNDVIDTTSLVFINPTGYTENLDKFKVVKNDLLIAMSGGTTGKLAINNTDTVFYLNQRVGKFEPKPILLKTYLYYFLSTKVEECLKISLGAAQPNLSTEQIKGFQIPLPPIKEQQRVVSILNEVYAAIETAKANTERNLQNAKDIFESCLHRELTTPGNDWIEQPIKAIGQTQTGTTPSTSTKSNYGNFIPFIKPAAVDVDGNGRLNYQADGLSAEGQQVARIIKKGSVLMVCIGATIGKVGYSDQEVSCNQQINTLTPRDGCHPKFFYYCLRSREFYDKVILNSAQATLPIINKGKWESLTVCFPKSFAEQKGISDRLDLISIQTKKLLSAYDQKLDALEALKKSILQHAFDGSLKAVVELI